MKAPRVKITDHMVEAAIAEFTRHAEADGYRSPTRSENPRMWAKFEAVVRDALTAAAAVAVREAWEGER